MRDYQVQGLNWMASLHHNGINGILADEMVSPTSHVVDIVDTFRALVKLSKPLLSLVTSSFTEGPLVPTSSSCRSQR